MGGTILKRIHNGDIVYIVVVCAGEIHFEHNSKTINRDIRIQEFNSVLNAYGCDGKVLNFTQESALDTVPLKNIIKEIEDIQDSFRADIWYIPGNSYHQDHRRVFEAAAAASRPSRKYVPKEIYAYEHPLYSWNPPVWRFVPQVYEDITSFLDKKIEICELYESQLRTGALSTKHIKDYSVACGSEAGVHAAERFEVIRIIR